MLSRLVAIAGLVVLAGCVSEARINADLARHVGQSQTDLVREMGVPTRHFSSDGHEFLAYIKGFQQVDGFDGGPGYGGWGGGWGGWGGWGWGGYGYGGFGGGGYPTDIVPYACETDFELVSGRVVGFSRHGNDC